MKKLLKAVTIILVMAMSWSSISAVLAEESTEQSVHTEAPVVSEPTLPPIVVEEPTKAPSVEATSAPDDTSVSEEPVVLENTETPEETAAPDDSQVNAEEIIRETPVNEELAVDLSNVYIIIKCVNGANVKLGDTVTLVAEISGLDGIAYSMQWQYQNGGTWHDMSGANEATYRYTVSEKNADYTWRLALTVD